MKDTHKLRPASIIVIKNSYYINNYVIYVTFRLNSPTGPPGPVKKQSYLCNDFRVDSAQWSIAAVLLPTFNLEI